MKDLYDQASDVACYYRAYGSYRGNVKTAVRALRGRMPGKTVQECEVAFQRALLLVDRCSKLMEADLRSPEGRDRKLEKRVRGKKVEETKWEDRDVSHLAADAKPDFPEFSDETIHSVLMFELQYHLR